jgi:hypothetical protein
MMTKRLFLIAFVVLAIVGLIYITQQQRERFDVDPVLLKQLVPLNIRLSNVQRRDRRLQDEINAGAGKAAMNGIV